MNRIENSRWGMNSTVVVCCLATIAAFVAGAAAMKFGAASSRNDTDSQFLPPTILKADSASAGQAVSLATGRLSDEVEAVYVLDHNTLSLTCFVMDARLRRQPVGTFRADLRQAFPTAAQGNLDLVMVTGLFFGNVAGRTGPLRLGENLCYVADGTSGMLAVYSVQFNQQGIQNAVEQSGNLNLIWQGLFRDPRANPAPPVAPNPADAQGGGQGAGKGGN